MTSENLDLPFQPFTLAEAAKRIIGHEATMERMLAPLPDAPPDSPAPRLGVDLEFVETPVRTYTIDGHETKIVVPEAFAEELDAVRRFRLGLEGVQSQETGPLDPALLNHALPEDFVAHLDALPRSDLIDQLVLLNEQNPMDRWHRKATGNEQFVSQASTLDWTITFFVKRVDDYLGDELRHEWAHLASERMSLERNGFDFAAEYEGKTYVPRERALANANERFAV